MTRSKEDVAKIRALSEWYDTVIRDPETLQRPKLGARRERIEAARSGLPPAFRAAFGLYATVLTDWYDAIEDNDVEGLANAFKLLRSGPKWLRKPADLPEIMSYIEVRDDPPIEVVIAWHLVPRHLRAATESLASTIVDAGNGYFQPRGPDRKKRLSKRRATLK